MGKINRASNKEAGKSKDPEIFLKNSKGKKKDSPEKSNPAVSDREVLIKVGGIDAAGKN